MGDIQVNNYLNSSKSVAANSPRGSQKPLESSRKNIFSGRRKNRKNIFNLTGLEDQSDAESDKTSSKNIKGSQLASLFTPEEELVVFNQNPSGKDILLRAIDQYEKYFKNSVREIKELRRELGELSWTNRELKMAVKQKARQNAFLLNKIE